MCSHARLSAFDFVPLVRRRAVAGVKRVFGEELSELATLKCFLNHRASFSSRFSRRAAQGTPSGATRWGRLLFGYLSLGGARESNPREGDPSETRFAFPVLLDVKSGSKKLARRMKRHIGVASSDSLSPKSAFHACDCSASHEGIKRRAAVRCE